jgi:hypothetical protein
MSHQVEEEGQRRIVSKGHPKVILSDQKANLISNQRIKIGLSKPRPLILPRTKNKLKLRSVNGQSRRNLLNPNKLKLLKKLRKWPRKLLSPRLIWPNPSSVSGLNKPKKARRRNENTNKI